MNIGSKRKALIVAGAASDKKALDIIIIKMRRMSSVCDYFVIASGKSTTQTKAIADHVVDTLKSKGEVPRHAEGAAEGSWILLDCRDVVLHVFLEDTRRFYSLEKLWGKAPQEHFKEKMPAPKRKKKKRKR